MYKLRALTIPHLSSRLADFDDMLTLYIYSEQKVSDAKFKPASEIQLLWHNTRGVGKGAGDRGQGRGEI